MSTPVIDVKKQAAGALATLALVLSSVAAGMAQPPAQQPPVQKPPVQQPTAPQAPAKPGNGVKPPPGVEIPVGVSTPPDYVIGPEDVLTVVFWRDKDLSGDATVRPDGMISLPLLNDVQAAGLTPEQLRTQLTEKAGRLIEEPTVTVVVKAINSRRVFLTGNVAKPGAYSIASPTTVLQLIATAGGLLEYAKSKNIRIMRTENGKPVSYKFNYKEVTAGKNLKQDILLKPGDTVIVP
jgi:polysaccharide export outer membrane protein